MYGTVSSAIDPEIRDVLEPLAALVTGGFSEFANLRGINDTGQFGLDLLNSGVGVGGARLEGGSGGRLRVLDASVDINGGLTINTGGLNVSSGTTNLGTTNIATLNVLGNTTLGDNAAIDTLTVSAIQSYSGAETHNGAATFLADVTIGATVAKFDIANTRVLIGTATALGSATSDRFAVVGGRAYLAPNGEETALGLRYNSTVTGSVFLGASNSNTPDLIVKNNAGTQIARAFTGGGWLVGTGTALTGSEMLEVSTGGVRVSSGGILLANSGNIDGNGGTAGQIRIGAVIAGAASLSGSEKLRVSGTSRLEGAATITTGGLTVSSGGITLAGSGNIDGNSGTAGELRIGGVIVNAASLSGTEKLRVNGGCFIQGDSLLDNVVVFGTGTVLTLSGSSQTQTTVGGAGGADALPATPRGYFKCVIAGSNRLVPYYDA